MPRAVSKQISHRLRVGLKVLPGSGPANHAQLVIITLAHRIRAMLDKQTNDGDAVLFDSEMQRVGVVAFAANIRIGPALEQQLHCCFAVTKDSLVQRRSHALAAALVDQLRMPLSSAFSRSRSPFPAASRNAATLSAVALAASSVLT